MQNFVSKAPSRLAAKALAMAPASAVDAARKLAHPALRARLKRFMKSGPTPVNHGTVSVIVPCFNVEKYLPACLNSIVRQSYPYLEILIVDDGSPDHSAQVARRYARWDRRIRVIHKPNGGLGSARNTGIKHAKGDFLSFVDSDDTVLPGAYARMVQTLAVTNSDFVIGGIQRQHGAKTWVPQWAQAVHRQDRFNLTLADDPEILQDVFSCNKLFRRTFWDRAVQWFPENIRYEDQEPTARAYTSSVSFDVLNKVVYNWLIRDDGSSITQQKANIADLVDRLEVKRRVSDVMAANAPTEIYRSWQAKAIGFDLESYYAQIPRTDNSYWETLRHGVIQLAKTMDQSAWDLVPLHDRLTARLVVDGAKADAETLIVRRSEIGNGYRTQIEDGILYGYPDYLTDLTTNFDHQTLKVAHRELDAVCTLEQFRWREPHAAEISGYAYIPGLDLDENDSVITAALVKSVVGSQSEQLIHLPVQRFENRFIDEWSKDGSNRYRKSAFTLSVDADSVLALSEMSGTNVEWYVQITVETAGFARSLTFRARDTKGSAGQFTLDSTKNNRRVAASFEDTRGLVLTVPVARVFAQAVTLRDRQLSIQLVAANGRPVDQLVLTCPAAGLEIKAHPLRVSGAEAYFAVELPQLPKRANILRNYDWRILAGNAGELTSIQYDEGDEEIETASDQSKALRLSLSGHGFLRLRERRLHIVATDFDIAAQEQELVIRGHADLPTGTVVQLVFVSDKSTIEASQVHIDRSSRSFAVSFPLTHAKWGRTGIALEPGGYSLRAIGQSGEKKQPFSHWIPVHRKLQSSLPRDFMLDRSRLIMSRTQKAAALWMHVTPPFQEDERGRYAQNQLQKEIPRLNAAAELRDCALFESFGGRSATDSPRRIFDEMLRQGTRAKLYWTIRDFSTPVPTGADPVLLHSRKWYEIAHTAKLLVNNNNFPYYFRKSPGQTYLQTWHGTPLKKIGNDVPAANLSLSYRKLMVREARYWDALLAQNQFAADTFPRAFGYSGPVHTLGYPRNDALKLHDRAAVTAKVRTILGIPADHTVILYAPTWRDDVKNSSNQYDLVQYLEYDKALSSLGSGFTILVRGHSNTAAARRAVETDGVIDVTDYPEINELFFASDLLITDYSSLMFDFVVTGKPVLFLTPDLAQYRDVTRGFYLDFEQIAPGPLLRTTDEIVNSIRRISEVEREYAEKYDRFIKAYAPYDDGHAAQRVVETVVPSSLHQEGN